VNQIEHPQHSVDVKRYGERGDDHGEESRPSHANVFGHADII
jgi:hypothetical protein